MLRLLQNSLIENFTDVVKIMKTRYLSIALLFVLGIVTQLPTAFAQVGEYVKTIEKIDFDAMREVLPVLDDADIDATAPGGITALMIASRYGETDLIQHLLERGANVNAVNDNGGSPLMFTAVLGDVNSMRLLLDNGANVHLKAKFNWTALTVSAAKGHDTMVSLLLDRGANPNARDIYQWTPLMRTVYGGHADVVRVLLDRIDTDSVDVNAQDETGATVLHHAVASEQIEIVKLLVGNNAMQNLVDDFGYTPKARAEIMNHQELVSLLEKNGY